MLNPFFSDDQMVAHGGLALVRRRRQARRRGGLALVRRGQGVALRGGRGPQHAVAMAQ